MLKNGHRELDEVEVVYNTINPGDQDTDAQFTLQPYQDLKANVHRITSKDTGQIALVMNWKGPNQPVTFKEYYGQYTFANLPSSPDNHWTTGNGQNGQPNQNPFIPDDGQQEFHLNLWWGSWTGTPPATQQEVTVTNFQHQKQSQALRKAR